MDVRQLPAIKGRIPTAPDRHERLAENTMSSHSSTSTKNTSPSARVGELFFLDLSGERLLRAHTDGSGLRVLVEGLTERLDGIAGDAEDGHIYCDQHG